MSSENATTDLTTAYSSAFTGGQMMVRGTMPMSLVELSRFANSGIDHADDIYRYAALEMTATVVEQRFESSMEMYWEGSSTNAIGTDLQHSLASAILRLLTFATQEYQHEVFVSGMDSYLSYVARRSVADFGSIAISPIRELIKDEEVDFEVRIELLKELGRIDNHRAISARLKVLYEGLYSYDVRIRDAAALGIESIDDLSLVDGRAIEEALESEVDDDLHSYLEYLLNEIRRSQD